MTPDSIIEKYRAALNADQKAAIRLGFATEHKLKTHKALMEAKDELRAMERNVQTV